MMRSKIIRDNQNFLVYKDVNGCRVSVVNRKSGDASEYKVISRAELMFVVVSDDKTFDKWCTKALSL